MRTDYDNLNDGDEILLYPNELNPVSQHRHKVIYSNGCFYCEGEHQPEYYLGDIGEFNNGFNFVE